MMIQSLMEESLITAVKMSKAKSKPMSTKAMDSQARLTSLVSLSRMAMRGSKVSKLYKECIEKAKKALSYSRDIKSMSKESIKYYINKAMEYYKKAFTHCRNSKDTARLYYLIAECHMEITPRQYEHDMKGKHLAKATECLKKALSITDEFNKQILDECQIRLKSLVQRQLIEKIDDAEFLCTLYEMIFQNIHKKMIKLLHFVGQELYSSYYKIASEITDCRGDLENATRYLEQCKAISKTIGISDNQVIDMKLEEIKKLQTRKSKLKNVTEAKSCINLGGIY